MLAAEHRRPFAAFLLVCAAGFLITGFGLRTQVVQVLVDNGAPAALVGVVAPDVMLGETLSSKPAPPAEAAPSASAPTAPTSPTPRTSRRPPRRRRSPLTVPRLPTAPRSRLFPTIAGRRPRRHAHAQSSATVAAVSTPVRPPTATPAPAPAAIPAPAPGKPSAGKPTPVRAELQAPTTEATGLEPDRSRRPDPRRQASAGRGHGHGQRSWSRRRSTPAGTTARRRGSGPATPRHRRRGATTRRPRHGESRGSLTPRPSRRGVAPRLGPRWTRALSPWPRGPVRTPLRARRVPVRSGQVELGEHARHAARAEARLTRQPRPSEAPARPGRRCRPRGSVQAAARTRAPVTETTRGPRSSVYARSSEVARSSARPGVEPLRTRAPEST